MATFAQVGMFNAQLYGIIELLCKKFPDDKNLSFTKTHIELAKQTNSKLPALHFTKEITNHLDQLKNRDDAFFLTLAKTKYDDVLSSMDLPHKWSSLNTDEKDFLWKTTETLAKLGLMIRDASM
jgi:hypothetical protein